MLKLNVTACPLWDWSPTTEYNRTLMADGSDCLLRTTACLKAMQFSGSVVIFATAFPKPDLLPNLVPSVPLTPPLASLCPLDWRM